MCLLTGPDLVFLQFLDNYRHLSSSILQPPGYLAALMSFSSFLLQQMKDFAQSSEQFTHASRKSAVGPKSEIWLGDM